MQKVKRRRYHPWFYWFCTHLLRFLLWTFTRWKVYGRENVPLSGPLIVVSNHLNNSDPPILGSAVLKRPIRFMGKVEVFNSPFGAFPTWWGAFPVRRLEADVGALMAAERMLRNGEVLGMFPEGTRSRTGKLAKAREGTALIALRSGAPVLPCAITGTERFKNPFVLVKRPRFTVTIGKPIPVQQIKKPTEEQVSELTERMMAAIAAMLPPQYLDTYTGSEVGDPTHGPGHPSK